MNNLPDFLDDILTDRRYWRALLTCFAALGGMVMTIWAVGSVINR